MSNKKIYWRGTEELEKDAAFVKASQKEFAEELPIDKFLGNKDLDSSSTSRRDFLKFMGFGITAATLAACETPVIKSLPYVVKPNEVMPGIANYYASTYFDGFDYAAIKTREGRPIHIEGNKASKATRGGVSARVNSSVLSLYNKRRDIQPMMGGQTTDFASIDSDIKSRLEAVRASGGNVRVLSSTMISPSSLSLVKDMGEWLGAGSNDTSELEETTSAGATLKHVMYDAVSLSSIKDSHQITHGTSVVPSYHFSKAKSIVSIDADFLVNWINPIGYSSEYAAGRNPEGDMSKHFQFETIMSTTGANADIRGAVRPSEIGALAVMLHNAVASKVGGPSAGSASIGDDDNNLAGKVADAASSLASNRGKSLVVCGVNDPAIQAVVNGINEMLGNYGSTLDLASPIKLRQGSDRDVAALISEMNSGSVDLLFVMDSDPLFTMPSSWGFANAYAKTKAQVVFCEKPTKTTDASTHVYPVSHFLESWNDANPVGNEVSFTQPTISPIYAKKQWQDSLLTWMGVEGTYYDYLKAKWNSELTPQYDPSVIFASKWNKYVHDGIGAIESSDVSLNVEYNSGAVASAASSISSGSSDMEVVFYVKTGIGSGLHADNPWLQELPDPVTKVVWDNYVTMNPSDMNSDTWNLNTMMGEQQVANTVKVTVGGLSVELPVVAMPGQKKGTIGIALGYGNTEVDEDGVLRLLGANVFPMLQVVDGYIRNSAIATVERLDGTYNVASTQTHHTMMGRKILNETSLASFTSNGKDHWNPEITVANSYGVDVAIDKLDLWSEHDLDLGHRWGLSIDLNSCIGCGSCVTACHSENNVPVVGKDEVNRTRTMSWMRIDRYYSSDADPVPHSDINIARDYQAMEVPSDYPEVGFMPVMCQHCNHAPCETVCPVAATTHSDEGFNQMTYNRCIGTRYCANNCPYKVRKFNWFNYVADHKFTGVNPSQDSLARMVLNPDVVVRSRGVMEKCSMCVQRVQAGKLQAKKDGTPVKDGSIQTACATSCPTNAIAFGDINDSASRIRSEAKNDRAYHLLEEVGVKPNVWYQTKVRNIEESEASHTA
jgi:MoCo/4Fe-4S cofactor protein with predicted Tat translocation signal